MGPINRNDSKGMTDDRRHMFVSSFVYGLPSAPGMAVSNAHGAAKGVVSGLRLSAPIFSDRFGYGLGLAPTIRAIPEERPRRQGVQFESCFPVSFGGIQFRERGIAGELGEPRFYRSA